VGEIGGWSSGNHQTNEENQLWLSRTIHIIFTTKNSYLICISKSDGCCYETWNSIVEVEHCQKIQKDMNRVKLKVTTNPIKKRTDDPKPLFFSFCQPWQEPLVHTLDIASSQRKYLTRVGVTIKWKESELPTWGVTTGVSRIKAALAKLMYNWSGFKVVRVALVICAVVASNLASM